LSWKVGTLLLWAVDRTRNDSEELKKIAPRLEPLENRHAEVSL